MEHLLEELHPTMYLEYHLFGIDLSITKAVILLFLACFIVLLMVWLGGRKKSMVPTGMQNVMESLLDFVRMQMVIDVIGPKGMAYFPWIATLFLMVLVSNIIGLFPKSLAITGETGTTFAWALIVFGMYNVATFKEKGFLGYFKSFAPSGTPVWLMPIIVPIEMIGFWVLRPFSLAVRLFANMTAGHIILLVFTFMAATGAVYIKPLPFVGVVIMLLFEVFVCAIQAYIFAILAGIYVGQAVQEH
jgi:F-type H+-transporting ATPase subunit a